MALVFACSNREKQKIRHEYLYWEFPELDGERAVRMGKWKALWGDIKHGNNHIQLFNLDNDVREEHDVAAQHPDIIKQIRDIMKKEHVEAENPKFRM